jgi:hypothetical protein
MTNKALQIKKQIKNKQTSKTNQTNQSNKTLHDKQALLQQTFSVNSLVT